MLEEWVLRTLFAMLVANVFIAGLYVLMRGHLVQQTLRKFKVRTPAVLERMGGQFFGAVIKWRRQGESVHAVEPGLFTFMKKERIHIYTSPHSYEFTLDMWPKNGRGLMFGGGLLILLSFAGFFLLIL